MAFQTQPYGPSAPGPGALGAAALVLARAATVFLGAIPATGLLFVALSATSFAGDAAHAIFGAVVLVPLAALGTVAMWVAALRPWPVSWLTALGLIAGALAMLGFGGYPVLIFPMLFLPPLILALLDSAGLYMPLLVALAHIVGFVICTIRK